jgi:hypothetical protein
MRYFLHIRDGADLIEDPDGSELLSVDDARAEAVTGVRSIMAHALRVGDPLRTHRVLEITSEGGEVLQRILFADLLI